MYACKVHQVFEQQQKKTQVQAWICQNLERGQYMKCDVSSYQNKNKLSTGTRFILCFLSNNPDHNFPSKINFRYLNDGRKEIHRSIDIIVFTNYTQNNIPRGGGVEIFSIFRPRIQFFNEEVYDFLGQRFWCFRFGWNFTRNYSWTALESRLSAF